MNGWCDEAGCLAPVCEHVAARLTASEARAEKAEAEVSLAVGALAGLSERLRAAEARLREVEADIRGIANHFHALAELPDEQRSVRSARTAYLHAEEHVRFLVARASRREGEG